MLDKTLERMQELHIPGGIAWELLIVNNNCTDHTDEVIARHVAKLPIKRLLETKQGLSNARNCAVEAASGDLLIWTDDDVLVDKEWLAEYAYASIERPECAFFGGLIEPWFEDEPPGWLKEALESVDVAFAVRDFGDESFEYTLGRIPFGANFAIRTAVQRKYRYDPHLGRIGQGMLGGDETTVIDAMLQDGLSGMYLPKAVVQHFIPRSRQTIKYLRSYYGGHGQLMYRSYRSENQPNLLGKPRWLWRSWLVAEFKYRFHRLVSPPRTWVEDLKQAATWRGFLRGEAS